MVEPPFSVPYWMSDWPARSSAFSMGVAILSTVRKAARLAVYEEIRIRVKNHQMPPTMRVEAARGLRSDPCCISVPTANQKLLARVKSF